MDRKTAFILALILLLHGIVGRMEYDDAVAVASEAHSTKQQYADAEHGQ